MDRVDKQTRSKIMASVGQKNTGVERMLRSALHDAGLRYRIHDRTLPGSPDLVFPRFRAVVFIHGCYWHAHGCHRSTVPKTRRDFWEDKFDANKSRDERKAQTLLADGWRVLTVWECALRGKTARNPHYIASAVRRWLQSSTTRREIGGGCMRVHDWRR
jgi:DNA mismatch endonuclease (patch repair protein)